MREFVWGRCMFLLRVSTSLNLLYLGNKQITMCNELKLLSQLNELEEYLFLFICVFLFPLETSESATEI